MSDRWARMAPLTGVLFVVLLVVGSVVPGSVPKTTASGAEVVTYASDHQNALRVSAILIGISLLVGLVFYGELRALLRKDSSVESLAAISFGGAVLFATGGGTVSGVALAVADQPSKLDPAAAQTLNILYIDLPLVLLVGLGIVMFTAGIAIVRSGLLPSWLGWSGIVLGVVGVFPLGLIALILGALWTLAASIVMTIMAAQPTR